MEDDAQSPQELGTYQTPPGYLRGRSLIVIALWLLADALIVSSWIPGSTIRRAILRMFGARIGTGVVIKPRVKIKYPWKLEIGDSSWIGEGVWIDNLASVSIGANVCVSQGAYLCTGSHSWTRRTFDLIVQPIDIEEGAWIAAASVVGPGVRVRKGAVLALGSVATAGLDPFLIYRGNPAEVITTRTIR